MHNKNKKQNNRQNPTTEEISYRISGKGKSWSYEYGKLYPGRYKASLKIANNTVGEQITVDQLIEKHKVMMI